jgi:2-furoyl-CoA dehydrogenase large subunit
VNDPKTSIRPANWTGRYADDLGTRPGTLHAAFLRSPYAHARIKSIDVSRALAHEGVRCVLVGADIRNWTRPFVVGVKQPMEHWCIAVDKVRYAGEPIAVVVAQNRYIAEDALDLIEVEYEATEAVVDTEEAIDPGAPVLHEAVGSNVVSDRQFVYGEPDAAFSAAPHRVKIKIRFAIRATRAHQSRLTWSSRSMAVRVITTFCRTSWGHSRCTR